MTVVFPGLSCDMVLMVASIGSEGLLGMEALPSCLPHQLDLRMGQLWADGSISAAVTSAAKGCSGFHPIFQFPCSSSG